MEGQTAKNIMMVIDTLLEIIKSELKANNKISFQSVFIIENVEIKGRSGNFNGVKWKTEDRLVPKLRFMKKFKNEVQNG